MMTRMMLFAVLASTQALAAADLDEVVSRLSDDEFDAREAASESLVRDFPPENVERYLDMADKEGVDPETRMRLRSAAKCLFMAKVVTRKTEYKRLMGQVGFEFGTQYSEYAPCQADPEEGRERYNWSPIGSSVPIGICVDDISLFTPADGKLRKWDVITVIDGRRMDDVGIGEFVSGIMARSYGMFEAGREYAFTVRRYKDLEKIGKRGVILPVDEYDEIVVKITAGNKQYLSESEEAHLEELRRSSWTALVEARAATKGEVTF